MLCQRSCDLLKQSLDSPLKIIFSDVRTCKSFVTPATNAANKQFVKTYLTKLRTVLCRAVLRCAALRRAAPRYAGLGWAGPIVSHVPPQIPFIA